MHAPRATSSDVIRARGVDQSTLPVHHAPWGGGERANVQTCVYLFSRLRYSLRACDTRAHSAQCLECARVLARVVRWPGDEKRYSQSARAYECEKVTESVTILPLPVYSYNGRVDT